MSFLFCPDPLCSASRYRLDGLSDPPGGEANHGYTVAGGSTTTDEACVKRDAEVLSPRGTGERNGANDSNGAAGSAESRGAGTEWGSQSASGMFPSSGETEVERVCGLLTDLVDTPSQAMSQHVLPASAMEVFFVTSPLARAGTTGAGGHISSARPSRQLDHASLVLQVRRIFLKLRATLHFDVSSPYSQSKPATSCGGVYCLSKVSQHKNL